MPLVYAQPLTRPNSNPFHFLVLRVLIARQLVERHTVNDSEALVIGMKQLHG
jgi:hypothetical protein